MRGWQADVSATHSDAHAPQIYTRLFWCMIVCETGCHQIIHSTCPRGLPLLLVDRRMHFLQLKRSCGVSEDEHLIPPVIWLAFIRSSRRYLQSTEQLRRGVACEHWSCDAFPHIPWLCFSGHTRALSRLTSIYTEYNLITLVDILLSTCMNVYNDATTAMENYSSLFNFLNSSLKPLRRGQTHHDWSMFHLQASPNPFSKLSGYSSLLKF